MKRLIYAIAIFAFSCSVSAVPITYVVNTAVGPGGVTGSIKTDGSTNIGNANILDWNLVISNGTGSFNLLGPLSGSNSQVGVSGVGFTATPTNLSFDYGSNGWVILQAPVLFSGFDFWCMQGAASCSGTAGTGNVVNAGGSNIFEALSGSQVIATAVPEAETYAMLAAVLGIVGLMARRRKPQQT